MGLFGWLFKPTPQELGKSGENTVASKLFWTDIFGKEGLTLQNLYIPEGNDKNVEIDLLYITVKGIFVIESKNYSGYIFGSEDNRYWTSTLYAGKSLLGFKQVEKHHFYNPIWQNKTHINCLRKTLKTEIPMFSIIVFSDRCAFKSISYNSENTSICHYQDVGHEIGRIWRNVPNVISDEEVDEIKNNLMPFTKVSDDRKARHVARIQSGNYSAYICPLCGGKLVLRTAKKGPYAGNQFYGCSNYPKCKFTKNI